MLILLLPLTTICVALVGFYVWHRQLIRKRLFEVAEAGLSAFSHADVAVAYARRPIHEAGEGTSRKRAENEPPAQSDLLDRLYVPLERLRHHNEAFGELERAAFNVEVHFGDEVARNLREPLKAYNRIAVVTSCRMSHLGLPAHGQVSPGIVHWWERVVYASGTRYGDYSEGGSREVDQVSIDMAKARAAVETALKPYLDAPTFGEFLFPPEAAKWVKRARAWVTSVARRPARPSLPT
jgi:hypothetical protein